MRSSGREDTGRSRHVALLLARDLTKIYRDGEVEVHALRGVSLAVSRGEFVAIMGPSGSGKTTLLEILGCLSGPTSGVYFIDGQPVHDADDRELAVLRNRTVGFVFQSFNLLPRLSVVDNVELPLVYRGVEPIERRRRAVEMLERIGLGHRLRHLPTQLSGGQIQRAAIARALVGDPLLILADEPTGNLDSAASDEVMTLLGELNRQGSTILLVTHEGDVARHAHRQILVRDGRIAADEKRVAGASVVGRHEGV